MSLVGERLADAELASALRECEPGLAAMAMLRGIDTGGLDVSARIDVAAAWERQVAWVQAQAQAALAVVAGDGESLSLGEQTARDDFQRDVVAAEMGWSPLSAGRRLANASALVGPLAPLFQQIEAGEVSLRHGLVAADAVFGLTFEEAAAVAGALAERAAGMTVAAFARLARRVAIAVAPQAAAQRRAGAKAGRGVFLRPFEDGLAQLSAVMLAEDAQTVFQALDAQARKAIAAAGEAAADVDAPTGAQQAADAPGGADDVGADAPLGVRRAEALLAWALQALAAPDLPTAQGRKTQLQVVVSLPALLGMVDDPAMLVGYGPIPAQAARELAADASWRRLVVEPVDGHLLDFGAQVYRPPQALVDYLLARDRRCRFPGCSVRADACDLDHVIPFGTPGGITASSNLAALCRRHHRAKTHGGWRYVLHPDSSITWTSPQGREFHVDPAGQLE